jgi:naphthoate synthase
MSTVVSELFDADVWVDVPGFGELTDITYHHDVRRDASPASPSTGPRCATRSGRTPSTSCTARSTTPAEPAHRRRAADRQRSQRRRTAGGRSAPAATSASAAADGYHLRRTARPDAGGVFAAATGRLHILEVQRLIRFMPKVVICGHPRVGCRRRPQPARHLRPVDRQYRARQVQADGRRRRQLRRRLRQRIPRPPGRAEVRS